MENNIHNFEQQCNNKVVINEDEIDFIEIAKKLWRNRKLIIYITLAFSLLGILTALSKPNVYTAYCTMVLQTGQKNTGGSLSGLAAIAGINLGSINSGEVLSPSVYPKIMTNINFQKELIYSKIHVNGENQPITIYEYFTNIKYEKFTFGNAIKKYTIGLPGTIVGLFKRSVNNQNQYDSITINSFSIGEKQVSDILNRNLTLNTDNKQGIIILTSTMMEPLAAAEIVQRGVELLQKYITEFKIEKVSHNLAFVEKSYNEAKRNFESKQEELAKFRDANKSLTSAVAKTNEEKIIAEYNLLLGIYSELAKQKEQAKIAVTETSPILTVIEPVTVPVDKAKSNRLMLIIIFTFIGIITGVVITISIPFLEENFFPCLKNYRFIPKIL